MKEKPILFSAPMVKAILEGRKSQTRRIIKPQPTKEKSFSCWADAKWSEGVKSFSPVPCHTMFNAMPYKPEDILWVRETFAYMDEFVLTYKVEPYYHIGYKADLTCRNLTNDEYLDTEGWNWGNETIKWKPSIFMPKDAARIFLRVKSVKVERVQDITEEDAVAEGVEEKNGKYRDYSDKNPNAFRLSAYDSYCELWAEINGIKSWEENPFVWVITFERINNDR